MLYQLKSYEMLKKPIFLSNRQIYQQAYNISCSFYVTDIMYIYILIISS